jgi:hypothetical protein
MKRMVTYLGIAAIFLAGLTALVAQERAQAPAYRDGDYWWYRVAGRIYELTIVAGKLKIFDPKPDQKIEIEDERAEALSGLVALGENDKPLLQFPLAVGKEWHAQYDTGRQTRPKTFGTAAVMKSVESRVTGLEAVTTPAGTFRAFKIERKETKRGRDSMSGSVYYSPETRSIVKYEYGFPGKATKVVELTKYGSGK